MSDLMFSKFLHDILNDLAGMRNNRDDDRVLVRLRFLERGELAVEERGRHEMPVACGQPARDQLATALEKNDLHVGALADEDIAVGALERRAGDHAVIADAARRIDPGGNGMQPGPAVLVGEWLA